MWKGRRNNGQLLGDRAIGWPVDKPVSMPLGSESTERGRLGLRHVSTLEVFLERLAEPAEHGLTRALGAVAELLGARALCLMERVGANDEPVVLALSGQLPEVVQNGDFHQLWQEVRRQGAARPCCRSAFSSAPSFLACACLARPGVEPLSLIQWGGIDSPERSELLLRLLLRIIDRLRAAELPAEWSHKHPETAATAPAHGLAFPDDYRVGESSAMARLYREMVSVTSSDLPILIAGETGVGKECVARILHASSERRRGPFLAINCAAIPHDLLEAEMFGVGAGVATGVSRRRGKFQVAAGGTLLLDEIGEMSVELQAKLLRALEERVIQPLGNAPVQIDVRVLATTNRDPCRLIEEGQLRPDLYYRVAGLVLQVPPLRQRLEDIPGLVTHFLERAAKTNRKSSPGLTCEALRQLTAYPWPGNVRQLKHAVDYLMHVALDGQAIDSQMLGPLLERPGPPAPNAPAGEEESLELKRHLEEKERQVILLGLKRAHGSQRQTAKLLGISRNGLAQKMRRLGIESS